VEAVIFFEMLVSVFKIYKTMVKPVVVYGSETWPMTAMDMERLNAWERRILMRISGPVAE
jgi:hypothetical protein